MQLYFISKADSFFDVVALSIFYEQIGNFVRLM